MNETQLIYIKIQICVVSFSFSFISRKAGSRFAQCSLSGPGQSRLWWNSGIGPGLGPTVSLPSSEIEFEDGENHFCSSFDNKLAKWKQPL